MSVQFGSWNFDGHASEADALEKVRTTLAPYGPDGQSEYFAPGLHILYFPFHATSESRREKQPYTSVSGAVLTWDGRLDNRADLANQLKDVVPAEASDVAIVAAAYERWRERCFEKLIGDWALSLWHPRERAVILAKDFLGSRHLYYSLTNGQITWCTVLDPLVLFSGKSFAIDEEYLAGWISFFPATHLTPYVGIHSVPPSCFVELRPKTKKVNKYWDFDPRARVRYRTDAEYEEQFRVLFGESVRRRLRSDAPVLAELSGGMDSSSIVCLADRLVAEGRAETSRLDTVSYYDDSEPNWNERPYFTKIEEQRRRTGFHIDVSAEKKLLPEVAGGKLILAIGAGGEADAAARSLREYMTSQGNRVVLSGIGGDEVLGGVPTPIPELADLLVSARWWRLARQLVTWSLSKRKPLLHLLAQTARPFLPVALQCMGRDKRPAVWIAPEFAKRHHAALQGYPKRLGLFGPSPSFQENLVTLESLRRQVGCSFLVPEDLCEKRYPYLDRNLLQFLYAIPRQQLVRPHQRRSLMRRALAGIVPAEILDRKRKAFVARSPLRGLSAEYSTLVENIPDMATVAFGMLDAVAFAKTLREILDGKGHSTLPVLRALQIEAWLRQWRDAKAPLAVVHSPKFSMENKPTAKFTIEVRA
jgi:asparagine synthase (glutamine-hydrolysing)